MPPGRPRLVRAGQVGSQLLLLCLRQPAPHPDRVLGRVRAARHCATGLALTAQLDALHQLSAGFTRHRAQLPHLGHVCPAIPQREATQPPVAVGEWHLALQPQLSYQPQQLVHATIGQPSVQPPEHPRPGLRGHLLARGRVWGHGPAAALEDPRRQLAAKERRACHPHADSVISDAARWVCWRGG